MKYIKRFFQKMFESEYAEQIEDMYNERLKNLKE